MTDIVDELMTSGAGDATTCDRAADEIIRQRREIGTLRNFLRGIKSSADLALRDYGQPTGAETNAMREEAIDLLGRVAEGTLDNDGMQEVHGWLEKYVPGWSNVVRVKP